MFICPNYSEISSFFSIFNILAIITFQRSTQRLVVAVGERHANSWNIGVFSFSWCSLSNYRFETENSLYLCGSAKHWRGTIVLVSGSFGRRQIHCQNYRPCFDKTLCAIKRCCGRQVHQSICAIKANDFLLRCTSTCGIHNNNKIHSLFDFINFHQIQKSRSGIRHPAHNPSINIDLWEINLSWDCDKVLQILHSNSTEWFSFKFCNERALWSLNAFT